MDVSELRSIRGKLDRFLHQFTDCIKTEPSRQHLRTYVAGQVSRLERKSVEPIALEAGVAPRTLQEFLAVNVWDDAAVRDRVQHIVIRDHRDENAVAVVDETSFVKKGDKTPGVQRQYCGARGKVDNCVVSVHLGYSTEDFHTLIDSDLYLPKETWCGNRRRCREAGIPDDVVYRPKWRIALDQVRGAADNGVPFRYVTADESYGAVREFRDGIAALGLVYVVEVPRSVRGWTRPPRMLKTAPQGAKGRRAKGPRLSPTAPRARRVEALWPRGGPRGQAYHIKESEKGPVVWQARATRFIVAHRGRPTQDVWLIVARNVLDGQVKYFLSNASPDTPITTLLHVAFSRWDIERDFQDGKGQVGFDHFEVRRYRAVLRHFTLSMVSLLFLAQETRRLRGKKGGVEPAPGSEGCRGAA